jgi:hypothetical protein
MKHMLLIAGALALSIAAPTLAKPGNGHGGGPGNGHGMGHGNAYAYGVNGRPVDVGQGRGQGQGYGVGGCPPGLANKAVPCVPPGQAKKLGLGAQVPLGTNLLAYSALPNTVRTRHNLSTNSRYLYENGTVYQVNPRTRTVTRVVRTR